MVWAMLDALDREGVRIQSYLRARLFCLDRRSHVDHRGEPATSR